MKILKYFFVGGAAAVVDIGLFYIGAGMLHWNYLLVGTCSFILATLVNYLISVRVVFQSGIRFSKRHELLLIFLISSAGLLLNQVVLYLCIAESGFDLLPAKLTATGSVFLWNYFMRSRFIFPEQNRLNV